MTARTVATLVTAHRQREGGGFIVRRPFPTRQLDQVDPFLMLDEMGPVTYGPGQAVGAPDHPHRGFETITYILDGVVEHADSMGHTGRIEPGGVQWMTAGSGVVHSEMPGRELLRDGGRMHGFQIWLNLPAALKMTPPQYQERSADQIPTATSPDGRAHVTVIAGQALGVQASISTHTPIEYHHWRLSAEAQVSTALPAGLGAFVYVFEGTATVAGTVVQEGQVAQLTDGDTVALASAQGAQLLVLAGAPLNEPVARYGPFVMNHRHELQQAVVDYQQGRMGRIPAQIR
jgi:redox-sensitive bicupin YhaK (pirin superfamily)